MKSFHHLKRLSGQRCFSAAASSLGHTVKLQQIDIEEDPKQNDLYHLSIPYEAQNLKLQLQLKDTKANHSLGTIAQGIKSLAASVDQVTFQTLDGATIPQNELLRHRNNIPFVMTLKMKGGS